MKGGLVVKKEKIEVTHDEWTLQGWSHEAAPAVRQGSCGDVSHTKSYFSTLLFSHLCYALTCILTPVAHRDSGLPHQSDLSCLFACLQTMTIHHV